ncbi:Interferon-induced GTP-binding protein MxB [Coniochaeta hoffmannii]|uniref:Interferon-induced GTP-binding protein MxB n=1 Tax=Coniochaeta hoffmannii TaxID=91930 RepID=A0AA38VG78_9PEZI|nr:Interferon-induced GTP-binding protein MxB [Coniochaeta hoffmannii]
MHNEPATLPTAFLDLEPEQRELLDTLSKLRRELGGSTKAPKIVVVGNQSAGKTSILEAISGIKFAAKDGKGTRIATQLNLRKAPFASVHVSRETDGALHHELQLSNFFSFDKDHDIVDIIKKAEKLMAAKIDEHGISDEVLQIEVSGPHVYPLTFVDLPGLRASTTSDQRSLIINKLADRFMSDKDAIIIAVASARYGIAPRSVLDRALLHDPQGQRTLGVLTKVASIQGDIVSLARNEDSVYKFRHGWHVLRNAMDVPSDADKPAKDDEVLSSPAWRTFPKESLGTKSLRKRVSRAVYDHFRDNLPVVMKKLQTRLQAQTKVLNALGPPRYSPALQRQKLMDVSQDFARLAKAAIRGDYSDSFFTLPSSTKLSLFSRAKDETRKFRTVIDDLNMVFFKMMVAKGHSRTFIDNDRSSKFLPFNPFSPFSRPKSVEPWIHRYSTLDPEEASMKLFLESIRERADTSSGLLPSGTPIDALVIGEFKRLSSRWRSMTDNHIEVLLEVAKTFVETLLAHAVGLDTYIHSPIMTGVVEVFFEARKLALRAKCEELLRHWTSGTPRPLQPAFRARTESDPRQHQETQLQLWENLEDLALKDRDAVGAKTEEPSSNRETQLDTRQVFDNIMAYYDMSLKTYIDNVVILAVENCLIAELPSVLDPKVVEAVEDAKIAHLVPELPERSIR